MVQAKSSQTLSKWVFKYIRICYELIRLESLSHIRVDSTPTEVSSAACLKIIPVSVGQLCVAWATHSHTTILWENITNQMPTLVVLFCRYCLNRTPTTQLHANR